MTVANPRMFLNARTLLLLVIGCVGGCTSEPVSPREPDRPLTLVLPDLPDSWDHLPPLHRAALEGRKDRAEKLLALGADINAKDDVGLTPLGRAVGWGHGDIALLLIAKGADIGDEKESSRLVGIPVTGGDLVLAKVLLRKGAKVHHADKYGRTSLHVVAFKGDANATRFLLANGANANATDKYEWTLLHFAARGSRKGPVVLNMSGDVDWRMIPRDPSQYHPIRVKMVGEHVAVARALLRNGADPDARDGRKATPLHYALVGRNLAMVKLLLSKGANPDLRMSYDVSPLPGSILVRFEGATKLLLVHGARVDVFSASGLGRLGRVRELVRKDAKLVNSRDAYTRCPLHWAATLACPHALDRFRAGIRWNRRHG